MDKLEHIITDVRNTVERFRNAQKQQWQNLAGEKLPQMLHGEEEAIQLMRDGSPEIRRVAIEVLQYHWKSRTDDFERLCEELSANDNSAIVRQVAITAIGHVFENSDNVRVSAFLANVVQNDLEAYENRKSAYRSLLLVRKGYIAIRDFTRDFKLDDVNMNIITESLDTSRSANPVDSLAEFVTSMPPSHGVAFRLEEQARQAYELGKYAIAVQILSDAIDRCPEYGSAFILRARANIELGKLDTAVADLSYVIQRKPELIAPLQIRASVYRLQGQMDLAEDDERSVTILEGKDKS